MKNLYALTAIRCLKIISILLLFFSFRSNAQELMRANMFMVDAGGVTLMDGNLTNYDNIYSNTVDIDDAWKMTNPGVNFGILRDGYNLVVERRSIIDGSDTTFFRMWNMPQHNYRIKFMLKNLDHPGLTAVLRDKFLNTQTNIKLNDTTYYDFTINANPASANQMRFQFIYGSTLFAPVDVSFTGIQAQRRGKAITVEWGVADEESMLSYAVEHSADGANFTEIKQVRPYNTPQYKTYQYTDIDALAAENFYRIKGTSMSGKIQYTPIAKVGAPGANTGVTVYPNPVLNKTAVLQFNGQPAGNYNIVLLYANGTRQQLKPVKINSNQSSQVISLPQTLSPGVYRLQLFGPDNINITKIIEVL